MNGLISGLDTTSMIQQILDARKAPITTMKARAAARRTEANAIKDIGSRMGFLLSKAKRFNEPTSLQGRTAGVSAGGTTATVSASATTSATVGSFKVTVEQLATSTFVNSASALSTAIDPNALLKNTNLSTSVTAGTFTVNGTQITVDPETQTLNDVMTQIAGVAGVTGAALVADSSGRNNLLQISSGANVTLGSGSDTSNFLTAMNLLGSNSGTTRTSTANLGVAKTGVTLNTVNFAGGALNASGSFKINGTEITYDVTKDSLSTVLSRINNSSAGVTASYDRVNDKVTLVSRSTGSVAIGLEDTGGGNFLQTIGAIGTAQSLGKNARFQVDTGSGNVTHSSTTNSVSDAVEGVTLTLLKESATADTVSVAQDLDGAANMVRDLMGQFNSVVDFIKTQTAIDKTSGINGTLAGDFTVTQLSNSLRRIVTEPIDGITTGKTTLAEIGLSFGAVGSAVGTTNLLQLDDAKFKAALTADPAGVMQVLSAFKAVGALQAGGTGIVDSLTGNPNAVRKPGDYTIETKLNPDGSGYVTSTFKPSDGGAAVTTIAEHVTAGSTNTSLIPGMTITFKGAITEGTDTVKVTTPTRGIVAKFEQFLDPLTRSEGVLSRRQTDIDKDITNINKRVDQMNERVERERDRLAAKFAAMEQAIARLKSQQSSLSALGLTGG
jgi:flagellar hook-associated protein 2